MQMFECKDFDSKSTDVNVFRRSLTTDRVSTLFMPLNTSNVHPFPFSCSFFSPFLSPRPMNKSNGHPFPWNTQEEIQHAYNRIATTLNRWQSQASIQGHDSAIVRSYNCIVMPRNRWIRGRFAGQVPRDNTTRTSLIIPMPPCLMHLLCPLMAR